MTDQAQPKFGPHQYEASGDVLKCACGQYITLLGQGNICNVDGKPVTGACPLNPMCDVFAIEMPPLETETPEDGE